jgi:hypothetical protein
LGGVLALSPTPLAAQGVREWGIQAITTLADPLFAGGGLYGGLRLGERARAVVTASPGVQDGQLAFRGELLAHLLVDGRNARRPQWYALGGLAGQAGPIGHGWLVLGVGLEAKPGAPSGWAAEVGVGGGFRLTMGYRWRRFPRGWVPKK